MGSKVLTRRRGKKYEYRFESASVGGKRQWISRGGFDTAGEAYAAGMTAWQEYRNSSTTGWIITVFPTSKIPPSPTTARR